jgi:hypothetical protein
MRNDEMEVGKVYKVRAGHGTKAKLEEKGIKRGYNNRSDGVKVTMLNGRFKDHSKLFVSRDVERLWDDEDEQRMISADERHERAKQINETLTAAGFEPDQCQVQSIRSGQTNRLYISFVGESAENVVAKLIDLSSSEKGNN